MSKLKKEEYTISEVQEEYLKMYHEYFVLHWSHFDICQHHVCSASKVTNAIAWVIKNRIKMPSDYLLKGAIDAISIRLKTNKILYDCETSKRRYRDSQFIIALSKEIREDEQLIYKLQEVYKGDEDDNKLSAGQVLSLIKKASDNTEKIE